MKRNSDYFTSPKRQSLAAILMIIIKTYKVIIRQIWPLLILVLVRGSKGGDSKELYIAGFIGVIALLAMIYSIINFFKKYYYVDNGELVLESGIIGKKRVAIPFERIQTINFEQSIVHRLLSVVRLKADTAGSVKNEFELDAITIDDANLLRKVVMEEKAKVVASSGYHDEDQVETPAKEYKSILHLNVGDLLKAGMVENHIRSFGIILALGFGLYENLQSAGMDVDDYTDRASMYIAGLTVILIIIALLAIVSFVLSMVRMVLTNYDLRFLRFDGGFKIDRGLFTQKSISALDTKIQTMSWSHNWLQKLIGLKYIKLEQAGSEAINAKKAIVIPGCSTKHVNYVTKTLYPDEEMSSIEMKRVDVRLKYRMMFFFSLISVPFILTGYFADNKLWVVGLLLLIYLPIRAIFLYNKKLYGFNDEMLLINGGAHGDKTTMTPIYKFQAVEIKQSPYQRRKDLATLDLHNAAGKDSIPYIPLGEAQRILNTFLLKVETDDRDWM